MSFIKVERPDWVPHRCCMTLRDTDPDGFYVGETIRGLDPHAFVSASAVRTMARAEGFIPGDEHQLTVEALEAASARVTELEAEVAERDAFIAAIDVIESKDFRARKRPGRPKATTTTGRQAA